MLSNKESVEKVLIQSAVKTTIQIRYDKRVFDSFLNEDKVLKTLLFVTRHGTDLNEENNVIQ